jgi:hypothetical protein
MRRREFRSVVDLGPSIHDKVDKLIARFEQAHQAGDVLHLQHCSYEGVGRAEGYSVFGVFGAFARCAGVNFVVVG